MSESNMEEPTFDDVAYLVSFNYLVEPPQEKIYQRKGGVVTIVPSWRDLPQASPILYEFYCDLNQKNIETLIGYQIADIKEQRTVIKDAFSLYFVSGPLIKIKPFLEKIERECPDISTKTDVNFSLNDNIIDSFNTYKLTSYVFAGAPQSSNKLPPTRSTLSPFFPLQPTGFTSQPTSQSPPTNLKVSPALDSLNEVCLCKRNSLDLDSPSSTAPCDLGKLPEDIVLPQEPLATLEKTSIDWSWIFCVLLATILAVIVILALVAAILAISAVTAGAASVVIAIGSHLLLNASAPLVGVVGAVAAVLGGFALEETTYGFFVQKMNLKLDNGSSDKNDYHII